MKKPQTSTPPHTLSIIGKPNKETINIQTRIVRYGFQHTTKHPDMVISYGGDGTLLLAERLFPGIPKLPIREHSICKKCYSSMLEQALDFLSKGKFHIKEYRKITATTKHRTMHCLNDIIIRNAKQNEALRFSVQAGKKKYDNLIGDGIVAATTFGSSGYFHSITTKQFSREGIGLAFNNCTTRHAPLFLKPTDKVHIHIQRGTAMLSVDNNPQLIKLRQGSVIHLILGDKKAKVVTL